MKKYVVLVRPNGLIAPVDVDPDNLLHDLQRLVGGYIEICPEQPDGCLKKGQRLIVNEEGKLNAFIRNAPATLLYSAAYYDPHCIIVGDAVIVKMKNGDIAPFDNLAYVERSIIKPLQYRLNQSLAAHDDQ